MKQQARKGIFETNSPFTHTLSLYNKKELEVLRNRNDVWLDFYGKREIITREQIENSKSILQGVCSQQLSRFYQPFLVKIKNKEL